MPFEFLDALKENWQPVSKAARLGWLAFYVLFLLYAFASQGPSLFIDLAFVPIHEGGHLLFRWFGETLYWVGLSSSSSCRWPLPFTSYSAASHGHRPRRLFLL